MAIYVSSYFIICIQRYAALELAPQNRVSLARLYREGSGAFREAEGLHFLHIYVEDFKGGIFRGVVDTLDAGVKSLTGISQKVLTQHLRAMEESGLIHREVYAEVPPRVEYSLTDVGRSLKLIHDAMWQWGEEYKANVSFDK